MRHYGFCKDFTGKRHQLPPKITKLLYKDGKVEKYVPKKTKKPVDDHKPIHDDVKDLSTIHKKVHDHNRTGF